MSPILKILRLNNLYVDLQKYRNYSRRDEEDVKDGVRGGSCGGDDGINKSSWRKMMYPTLILVTTWLNVIRCCSMFNENDVYLGRSIIQKLLFHSMFLQCAMLTTSYYIASNDGWFDRLLRES